MVQLEFLRYFTSKCENESLLVIPLPCGVPDGLLNFECHMMTCTHNVNNELSSSLKEILYNFKCVLCSLYQFNCFKTFWVIQAESQPYACEFCIRSNDLKGLKISPFKIGILTAFPCLF